MFDVVAIDLTRDNAALAAQTRGTGPQTVTNKFVVRDVPVPNDGSILQFVGSGELSWRALLYELRNPGSATAASVSPNWFGVAIPNPDGFDLQGDVFIDIYFHPTPYQAGYRNPDYQGKSTGYAGGAPAARDWRQIYAYVDRLGSQAAAAMQDRGAPANQIVVVPILRDPDGQRPSFTVPVSEWFNVLHDILQDINTNVLPGVCTRPKWVTLATLSNGAIFLNDFLSGAAPPQLDRIVEVWDFDSEISSPREDVNPMGKPLRAYWQNPPAAGPYRDFVELPGRRWNNFPLTPPVEIPPLPDQSDAQRVHHYIRDMMFLDAVFKFGMGI